MTPVAAYLMACLGAALGLRWLAMPAGPLTALLIAAVIVMFDPDPVLGDGEWSPR
ncbi:hypothetical protein ACFV2U_14115 [Streptomyces sp. NPDC059697]|uniref:hypothetical protein n=1 Tax=Streptomyces sp. NPDC059697 TaxID=3346912 RepID=UPI0036824607